MKSTELLLIEAVLADASIALHTPIDRDLKTIRSRFENEGLSFLTITLPAFAKDFERSLELGRIESQAFRAFAKTRKAPRIPAFLQGIVLYVFDENGDLRDRPSTEAIMFVRQVCLMFNKLKQSCTLLRQRKASKAYVECDDNLRMFRPLDWAHVADFRQIARLCFGRMFHSLEVKLHATGLVPKHGPGAVNEKVKDNKKYTYKSWAPHYEPYFNQVDYQYSNTDHFLDVSRVRGDSESSRTGRSVRIVFVPKTQKSPRVIAIEPCTNQYLQQAFLREIVPGLESDPLTRNSLHFTDSTINGSLARSSSRDRKYATLDLSEASDRIHAGLAYQLVRDYPDLAKAIFAVRSKYAVLPDGTNKPIVKFASMGSALCFPFEAMVFYTICLMGYLKCRKLTISRRNILAASQHIHVFGDDLIVPVDTVSLITEMLTSAGLKVNSSKSFSKGFFRESCGVDAYMGELVTPVYVRTLAPRSKRDVKEILSFVASLNLLYKKGCWETVRFMRKHVEGLLGPLPHVRDNSPALGYHSFSNKYSIERWNKTLHRFEFSGLKATVKRREDKLHGWDRLLKFFLTRAEEPSEVRDFDKSVVKSAITLKRTWIPST